MSLGYLSIQTIIAGLAGLQGSKAFLKAHGEIANPLSVPAAKPGSLTTRSSDTAGTLTMTSGSHGIVTGQRVDLYWTGGACFGATVGTVSGTSVPIATVSGGDALPAQDTAIKVGIPVETAFSVTGDDLAVLACGGQGPNRAYFVFNDGSGYGGVDLQDILVAAGEVYYWSGSGDNPLDGIDPATVWISHEDTANARDGLTAVALTD